MTKLFLLVLAAAATAHANVIIDKGSVAPQSDRKSTLSHCDASAETYFSVRRAMRERRCVVLDLC